MINHKFKAGDLVYCPSVGSKVYKLEKKNSGIDSKIGRLSRPLKIETDEELLTFNEMGYYSSFNKLPHIFPATNEMRHAFMTIFPLSLLEKVDDYHMRVDKLGLEAMREKIQAKLNKDGFAWCGVSDVDIEAARERSNDTIVKIVKIEVNAAGKARFFRADRMGWAYAYLIENP